MESKVLFVSACFVLLGHIVNAQYSPPSATVEPLSPKGIRISVPNEDGITLVAFHVKVNEEFDSLESGTISVDVIRNRNGRWTYEDRKTRLRLGDIVHYWVHVVNDGLGYNLLNQQHQVTEFFSTSVDDRTAPVLTGGGSENQACAPTDTKVIDPQTGRRESICSRQLLLHEQFDSFNDSIWTRVERFAGAPDYAFVIYRNDQRNVECSGGNLQIRPSLVQTEYSRDFIRHGNLSLGKCTEVREIGDYCQREARGLLILPPVFSGLVTTKNSLAFIYGKVEIRAKFPRGDWIYPILSLERLEETSASSTSGSTHPQLRIATSTGNGALTGPDGKDFSSHVLRGGPIDGKNDSASGKTAWLPKRYSGESWSNDYHVYELEWRRDQILSRVDGLEYGSVETKSPFDRPFYLNLGLAVGGHDEFPDSAVSGGYAKQWRNLRVRALFDFVEDTDRWARTWEDDSTLLKIDYVKVWAL